MSTLIIFCIKMYIYLTIIDAVIGYFPKYHNYDWVRKLRMIADYAQAPIRKYLPSHLPFDFSPVVVVVALSLIVTFW